MKAESEWRGFMNSWEKFEWQVYDESFNGNSI
jgi:hypothetical protein